MSTAVHAFDYLAKPDDYKLSAVTVLFGDEWLLRKLVLAQMRQTLFGEEDVPFESMDGDVVQWRDVRDELFTASLFGGGRPRLAVIYDADKFVSENRQKLEAHAEKPPTRNILVLVVKSFPSNTKLYKSVVKHHLAIDCRPPEKERRLDNKRIVQWLVSNARQRHKAQLTAASAEMLLDLVGTDFGRLDSETEKLALYAGEKEKITPELVRDLVGGWRAKSTWDMIDAALEGDAATALDLLGHLLRAGDEPVGIFAQFSWSLRQFAAATRLILRGERAGRRISQRDVSDALLAAGARPYDLAKAERRLRQIGRVRGRQLYKWTLEADLALKGTHSNSHRGRWILEQFILRLSKQAAPPPASGVRQNVSAS